MSVLNTVPSVTKTTSTYETIYEQVVLFDGSVLPVSGNAEWLQYSCWLWH